MLYTVGETAKKLNIAPSTLRYYDKEGLLPFVERSNGGIRVFKEEDFDWLFVIECLKKSGLSIKDIKRYIDMTLKGDETIEARLELLCKQRERVVRQIAELQSTLEVLEYKCRLYEAAKALGSVEAAKGMLRNELSEKLRRDEKNLAETS